MERYKSSPTNNFFFRHGKHSEIGTKEIRISRFWISDLVVLHSTSHTYGFKKKLYNGLSTQNQSLGPQKPLAILKGHDGHKRTQRKSNHCSQFIFLLTLTLVAMFHIQRVESRLKPEKGRCSQVEGQW